jgi:hypothetical protein
MGADTGEPTPSQAEADEDAAGEKKSELKSGQRAGGRPGP